MVVYVDDKIKLNKVILLIIIKKTQNLILYSDLAFKIIQQLDKETTRCSELNN